MEPKFNTVENGSYGLLSFYNFQAPAQEKQVIQTIAETSKSKVVFLSAVNAGVKEIREQIQYSENNWLMETK